MSKGYTDRLVSFLMKDVGGAGLSADQVRDFSKVLKDVGIIDMSESSNAQWLMESPDGQQVLIQLVSWYSLGLLTNINIIKHKCKEKTWQN